MDVKLNSLVKLLLWGVVLTLSACEIEARSCQSDNDCFENEYCKSNVCEPSSSGSNNAGPIENNGDCVGIDCSSCGDGELTDDEECDSDATLTQTCQELGFASGKVKCTSCKVDTSACVALESCKNNGLQDGELCDGDLFEENRSCQSEGFDEGELSCTSYCTLDTSACFSCGDGMRNGDEACDGSDFGGKTCQSEVGLTGPLHCANNCSEISTERCKNGVLQISSGVDHSCLVNTDGTIVCWGNSSSDALLHPQTGSYTKVVSGQSSSCALETNGKVRCWGRFHGESPEDTYFDDIAGGWSHFCGLEKDTREVICWGGSEQGKSKAPEGIELMEISVGGNHSCGIKDDRTLECWGSSSEISGMPNDGSFSQISSGGGFACGLLTNGTPLCFGNDDNGLSDRLPGNFVQLASGTTHVCGLLSDGSVKCWGNLQEDKGQLLVPDRKFTQITSGLFFSCGLTLEADVVCWGVDDKDQTNVPEL